MTSTKINFSDWTLEGLKNPLQIQGMLLDKWQESTGDEYAQVDGNNVVGFLLEGFSDIMSSFTRKVDDILPAIYASRAVSISDLYHHMSDYEYVGLFSSPARAEIVMILDKTYVTKNGVPVYRKDSAGNLTSEIDYRKMIIPASTRFAVGEYDFGIYYPIEIHASETTGLFTVMYNNDKPNPMHTLQSHLLEYAVQYHDGMELVHIKIPVYQFEVATVEEPLIKATGYRKEIQYTNKFYAIRCKAEVRDPETDEWTEQELSLKLDGQTYDPDVPTVVFSVDPSSKTIILTVPYVYFTQDRLRGNLTVDVYTTVGAMNYELPADTEEMVKIDVFGAAMDPDVVPFTEPIRGINVIGAYPVYMRVAGGSDGMMYETLRRKIINNTFTNKTLQTPDEVAAFFEDEGYQVTLFQDGVTDRVYIAHAAMRNVDNDVVAAASVNTLITKATLTETNKRTVLNVYSDTYTILPAMRYRFDPDRGIAIPLTDAEMAELYALDADDRVKAFNDNIYVYNPFHLQISTKNRYPVVYAYDMTSGDVISNELVDHQRNIAEQLSLNFITFTVMPRDEMMSDDRITDRYILAFNVLRSGLDTYAAIDANGDPNFRVVVAIKRVDGGYSYAEATFLRRESDMDLYQMEVDLTAAFKEVDSGHAVRVKQPFDDNGVDVLLNAEIRVLLCLKRTISEITGETGLQDCVVTPIEDSGLENIAEFAAITEHRVYLKFGNQVEEIDPRIALTYGGQTYETFKSTELRVTDAPVYELDENGSPKYTVVDGHVRLEVKYPKGVLTCFTKEVEETVMVTKNLRDNLAGRTWIDVDDQGGIARTFPTAAEWETATWTDSNNVVHHYSELEGREVTVRNLNIAPQFLVTDMTPVAGSGTTVKGAYTLNKAVEHGSVSRSTDQWFRSYRTDATDPDTAEVYSLKTCDLLEYIFKHVLTQGDGKTKNTGHFVEGCKTWVKDQFGRDTDVPETYKTAEEIFADVPAVEGMIVFVENDNTDADINDPRAAMAVWKRNQAQAKMYIRAHQKWNCILMCDAFEDPAVLPPGSEEYFTSLATIVEQDKTAGIVHGFGYLFSCSNTNNQSYISFLTCDENDVPMLGNVYNDDAPIDHGLVEKDTAWQNHVNKWPWEVEQWRRLSKTVVDNAVVPIIDDRFKVDFDAGRMHQFCEHIAGQVRLDAMGQPVMGSSSKRELQYLINMPQFDAKLDETSRSKETVMHFDSITSRMRTHFLNLAGVKACLYTNTKLYFEPLRSLGNAEFFVSGNETKTLPLDVTMAFRLHVTADVLETEAIKTNLEESIINLIDNYLASNSLDMVAIAQKIKSENSDLVKHVDVLGVNGDPTLQTMRCADDDARPHLKHILEVLDDGKTIDLRRGLTLDFVSIG